MSLIDSIKRQLRSVIEWENPQEGVLFQRWTESGDEIKNASKLIVNPGQGVIFVYEGKIQAVHMEEGMYDLKTDNIPFWTTITKVMQSFESEHKVGIYFFWRTRFLDQKWGTSSPVKYNDPVYKFPVSLLAHGNFSFAIEKPEFFFVNVVGGRETLSVSELRSMFVDRLNQPLADALATAGFSYAEIDKNRVELSEALLKDVQPEFEKLGFKLSDFKIEATNFDEDTLKRINRIADIQAESQAAEAAGIDYTKMQQLEAMREAARNEGGIAGMGVGMGAGIGLGQMMGGAMAGATQAPQAAPGAAAAVDPMAKLKQLKEMMDQDLITSEEYEKKKASILSQM
jgi:membrane protease subunit (stomatin/prohibitin family)